MSKSIRCVGSYLLGKRVMYRYSSPHSDKCVIGVVTGYTYSMDLLVTLDNNQMLKRNYKSWEILA